MTDSSHPVNPEENPRGYWHPEEPGARRFYRQGCRCLECRADIAAKARELREKRKARLIELPAEAHGRYATYYNWQCRDECPGDPETGVTCRQAATEYCRDYRAGVRR